MTNYREILRLTALGLSQRNIVQSIGVSADCLAKRTPVPYSADSLRHN